MHNAWLTTILCFFLSYSFPAWANSWVAYVTDFSNHCILEIDLETKAEGKTIKSKDFKNPICIAITPDGRKAYVANLNDHVIPIDLVTRTAGKPISVPGTHFPNSIAITPDGRTAYVVGFDYGTCTPIDIESDIPGTPIEIKEKPVAIAITSDGKKAYTANLDNSVTSIDLENKTQNATIRGDGLEFVVAIALTPDGKKAYVTNDHGGKKDTITEIDLSTHTATLFKKLKSVKGIAITARR